MMLTWKYTLPAFLVPFVFTLSPEGLGILLQAPVADIVRSSLTAALGICALAVAFGGWLRREASVPERIGAGVAGVLLCYANGVSDAVGLVVLIIVCIAHLARPATRAVTE
jgi:TRAP-type uncharacterized transport system fused permease subunit